jgi:hypothetical protein
MAGVAAPLSAKLCALFEEDRFKAFGFEITCGYDSTWSCSNDSNPLHMPDTFHF